VNAVSAAAFAYYRLGKRKEALEAAESARKYARGDLQVDAAEKMLDFLKEVWIPPAVEPAPPPAGQSNERHGVQVGP